MTNRIAIEQAYEPVEVDLWGSVYATVDIPRSVTKKAGALWERIEASEEDDEVVKLLGQLLDLKLVSTNGNKAKPSTMIERKWKADELTVRSIMGFLERLGEAERPTQQEP